MTDQCIDDAADGSVYHLVFTCELTSVQARGHIIAPRANRGVSPRKDRLRLERLLCLRSIRLHEMVLLEPEETMRWNPGHG